MEQAQQRAYAERIKVDNMQEARDFVDQFFAISMRSAIQMYE